MKKRTCCFVLQYYLPNKVLSTEKYTRSLPNLFFPFSSESKLLKDSICCDNLQELNVLETVKRNWRNFELDSEIIGSLYMQIQKNANDSNRVIFTETSSPSNNSFCSQEHSNDSRQPNTGTQIGLVTRFNLNTNKCQH